MIASWVRDCRRCTAQLIDAETDAHLWAKRFDDDASDLFAWHYAE